MHFFAILTVLFLYGFLASSLDARESGHAPAAIESVRQIIKECELIVICNYSGVEQKSDESNTPPIVHFHINEYLKGPPLGARLLVRYDYHDTSQEGPRNWKFRSSLLPQKNSSWILAFPNAVPVRGALDTYHGSIGRLEATQENLNLFYRELVFATAQLKHEKRNAIQKIREIVANSEGVYVGVFTRYEEGARGATWYHPPKAYYRPSEYLKGPPLSTYLPIKFEFGEVGQPRPQGWQFNKSMMPEKGSKWIIAIPNVVPVDGMFETYRGSDGRIEATEESLKMMYEAIGALKEEYR